MPKLLLLMFIITVVWYGFRALNRRNENNNTRRPSNASRPKQNKEEAPKSPTQDVIDSVLCPACQKYVAIKDGKMIDADCRSENCPLL